MFFEEERQTVQNEQGDRSMTSELIYHHDRERERETVSYSGEMITGRKTAVTRRISSVSSRDVSDVWTGDHCA